MNKNESKYFSTAELFDEALISLLEKKDIEYITIKEICEKAGVNRSTFYLHYENISDLVNECMNYINKKFIAHFNETEKDFINKLNTSTLEDLNLIRTEYLRPYLTYLKENKNVFKASFKNPTSMNADKRYSNLEKYVIYPIMDRYEIPEEKRRYILAFYLDGIVSILRKWIQSNCEYPLEEIESIIINCVKDKK